MSPAAIAAVQPMVPAEIPQYVFFPPSAPALAAASSSGVMTAGFFGHVGQSSAAVLTVAPSMEARSRETQSTTTSGFTA
jgi:hypothetical protein